MTSRWQPAPNPAPYTSTGWVYVIYVDGKVGYVGRTDRPYFRIARHASVNAPWYGKDIKIKVSQNRRYGEHLMREARLIVKLNPPYNKIGGRGQHKPWLSDEAQYGPCESSYAA